MDWIDMAVRDRRRALVEDPRIIVPWRRPCVVKALLVTDGGLDFGQGDFGLSTFVGVLLNDERGYVAFDVTVAHLRTDVADSAVMLGAPGISRSVKGFAFDDPGHFDPAGFDEVWLFGIETNFHTGSYPNRQLNPARYPADRLGDGELAALTEHMNRGGGLFATGDHGRLGHGLGSAVDRARNMRYWDAYVGGSGQDEVSMGGARRNDSNQIGRDAGSQFNDQSDDIPQRLDLKFYSTRVNSLARARYPHPVMCSRHGVVDVFPDHPHEGECRTPPDLGLKCADGTPEYPGATDGTGQVVPEIVAWGTVRAGNVAEVGGTPSKLPTEAHRFAVVSVYDGHRARVGRVVCDATWHHFVNVNLIGMLNGPDDGFLSTPIGRAAFDRIREYYVNVAVWIAPPERAACMRTRVWWEVLWNDRILEATLDDPAAGIDRIGVVDLFHIGVHARDVLGRAAGSCQSLEWLLPVIDRVWPELGPFVNPWWRYEVDLPPLPWFDPGPLVAVALGGAVVALRQQFPYPAEAVLAAAADATEDLVVQGAEQAVGRVKAQFAGEIRDVLRLVPDGIG